MAKNDEITLIIAKAFSRQPLTEKEKDACCSLTISELISKHCLNDIQAKIVMEWCALQKSNIAYEQKEDLLSEGFFSNLFKKKTDEKDFDQIVKTHLEASSKLQDTKLGKFIFDLNKLKNRIQSEGLSTEENYLPSKGYNKLINKALDEPEHTKYLTAENESLVRIKYILMFLAKLHKSFEDVKITSARRVNEDVKRSARHRDDLVSLSNIARVDWNKEHPRSLETWTANLVRVICQVEKIYSSKERNQIVKSVKKYINRLYKELLQIYRNERDINVQQYD